jgi:hypothetical protein
VDVVGHETVCKDFDGAFPGVIGWVAQVAVAAGFGEDRITSPFFRKKFSPPVQLSSNQLGTKVTLAYSKNCLRNRGVDRLMPSTE